MIEALPLIVFQYLPIVTGAFLARILAGAGFAAWVSFKNRRNG